MDTREIPATKAADTTVPWRVLWDICVFAIPKTFLPQEEMVLAHTGIMGPTLFLKKAPFFCKKNFLVKKHFLGPKWYLLRRLVLPFFCFFSSFSLINVPPTLCIAFYLCCCSFSFSLSWDINFLVTRHLKHLHMWSIYITSTLYVTNVIFCLNMQRRSGVMHKSKVIL